MTNLEFYKDELKRYIKNNPKEVSFKSDMIGEAFTLFSEERIDIWCNDEWAESQHFIDWLLEEHREPIKLQQWEKDFLELADYKGYCFCAFVDYRAMKKRGYFKGIIDTDMTIEEILENCEVVE